MVFFVLFVVLVGIILGVFFWFDKVIEIWKLVGVVGVFKVGFKVVVIFFVFSFVCSLGFFFKMGEVVVEIEVVVL